MKNLLIVAALTMLSSVAVAGPSVSTLETNLAKCERTASKPPFLGSELVMCSTERDALVAVLEPAYLACNAIATRPPFAGSELVMCGPERAALVRVKYLGNQAALPL